MQPWAAWPLWRSACARTSEVAKGPGCRFFGPAALPRGKTPVSWQCVRRRTASSFAVGAVPAGAIVGDDQVEGASGDEQRADSGLGDVSEQTHCPRVAQDSSVQERFARHAARVSILPVDEPILADFLAMGVPQMDRRLAAKVSGKHGVSGGASREAAANLAVSMSADLAMAHRERRLVGAALRPVETLPQAHGLVRPSRPAIDAGALLPGPLPLPRLFHEVYVAAADPLCEASGGAMPQPVALPSAETEVRASPSASTREKSGLRQLRARSGPSKPLQLSVGRAIFTDFVKVVHRRGVEAVVSAASAKGIAANASAASSASARRLFTGSEWGNAVRKVENCQALALVEHLADVEMHMQQGAKRRALFAAAAHGRQVDVADEELRVERREVLFNARSRGKSGISATDAEGLLQTMYLDGVLSWPRARALLDAPVPDVASRH
eukprot:TRINITY_DN14806_c0_g1_i2.p1 TRINITY_DN14806_c0_g1~~TRINITY_DN14806_c0_g1_i2.p1  ORF type:complete len:459 (-),score=81.57 TRINITY_DN14806_c0_g1_i2:344-1666(-)